MFRKGVIQINKQEYVVRGFVDLQSIRPGGFMRYIGPDGTVKRTENIISAIVKCQKIIVETENKIYRNFDIKNKSKNIIDEWNSPSIEQRLAEKCIQTGRHISYINEFDIKTLSVFDKFGYCIKIKPSQIKRGDHIQIECSLTDSVTRCTYAGILDIPAVETFIYSDEKLVIESKTAIFSSVNFENEFKALEGGKQ